MNTSNVVKERMENSENKKYIGKINSKCLLEVR